MSKYQFYNINPLDKIEEDCVCRAISGALDLCYYEIQHKLELVGDLFDCESLCVCCYKFLLDEVYCLERIEEFSGMTIRDFLEINPYGTYIIRCDGHLTHARDGVLLDTWDCSNMEIRIIWVVR